MNAVTSALAVDGDLLDNTERAAIEAELKRVESALRGEDREALNAAVEALDASTLGFAERRMDRGIRKALAGKTVAELEDSSATGS